jgi:hypothetical protein
MDTDSIIDVLNRLLHHLCRSLPRYLEQAHPWTQRDDESVEAMLAGVVADQDAVARQVARAVVEQGGRPDPGQFPMPFTAVNDLSLRSLLGRLIEYQRRDIVAFEQCVAALAPTPVMRVLAEEALGAAQGHLEIMQGLLAKDRPSP